MRSASPSALCTSIWSGWPAASAVSVAMPASGSPAARWVLARRIWAVTYQGEVVGDAGQRLGGERVLPLVLEDLGGEQARLDQVGADVRGDAGVHQRHPLASPAVLSASASVRKASAAPSRALVTTVEGHLLAGGEAVAQVEQRRVGDAAGQRVVDHLDRVGLAADLREDLGVRHDRGAVEVQRARPRRRRGSPRRATKSPAKASASALWYWP